MKKHTFLCKEVREMEDQVHDGVYQSEAVNIPIQLLSVTDRDGRITPLWFRLETKEHEIRKFKAVCQLVNTDGVYLGNGFYRAKRGRRCGRAVYV